MHLKEFNKVQTLLDFIVKQHFIVIGHWNLLIMLNFVKQNFQVSNLLYVCTMHEYYTYISLCMCMYMYNVYILTKLQGLHPFSSFQLVTLLLRNNTKVAVCQQSSLGPEPKYQDMDDNDH